MDTAIVAFILLYDVVSSGAVSRHQWSRSRRHVDLKPCFHGTQHIVIRKQTRGGAQEIGKKEDRKPRNLVY
jgi:hypothetical protein